MPTCLVGLGANLGARIATLEKAIARLATDPGVRVVARSRWFRTRPIGGPEGQGEFINAALRMETALAPEALHLRLRAVEAELGREHRERWAARVIDLDLLLYGDLVWNTAELQIPHPRMAFRRFVLEPAAEIAGELLHPVVGWTIGRLLDHLDTAVPYIALTGAPGLGQTGLARRAAEALSLRLISDDAADSVWPEKPPAGVRTGWEAECVRLQRRAELLDAAGVAAPAISDFWIGQSLVSGRLHGGRPVPAELESAWHAAVSRAVPPKLLAVLAAPDAATPLEQAIRDVLADLRPGPVLWLNAAKPAWALQELRAAIEAMGG